MTSEQEQVYPHNLTFQGLLPQLFYSRRFSQVLSNEIILRFSTPKEKKRRGKERTSKRRKKIYGSVGFRPFSKSEEDERKPKKDFYRNTI